MVSLGGYYFYALNMILILLKLYSVVNINNFIKNNKIQDIGKKLSINKTNGEFLGIFKISKNICKTISKEYKLLKKIKPSIYFKGKDYKNLSNDLSKNILLEKKEVEKLTKILELGKKDS